LEPIVIPGPSSRSLALSIAKRMNIEVADVQHKRFPDGESYIRFLGDVKGRRAIVVQSLYPDVDTSLFQLLMMVSRLADEGCKVLAVVPYLGYARQHREFLSGEVVSLKVVAQLIASAGASWVLTVDIHNPEGLGFFPVPAYSVSAIPEIARYFAKSGMLEEDSFVVSPDFGASAKAEALSLLLNVPYYVFSKQRDKVTGEITIVPMVGSLKGLHAILIDDIISTGGTVVQAARVLYEREVRSVVALCIHPLLIGGALERMKAAGVRAVLGTNTVESPVSLVDVAPAISRYLEEVV